MKTGQKLAVALALTTAFAGPASAHGYGYGGGYGHHHHHRGWREAPPPAYIVQPQPYYAPQPYYRPRPVPRYYNAPPVPYGGWNYGGPWIQGCIYGPAFRICN